MEAFLEIRLYPDLRGHPHPHAGPQYQQAQELFLGDTLLKASCYVCYESSFQFFLDPLGIGVGLWESQTGTIPIPTEDPNTFKARD